MSKNKKPAACSCREFNQGTVKVINVPETILQKLSAAAYARGMKGVSKKLHPDMYANLVICGAFKDMKTGHHCSGRPMTFKTIDKLDAYIVVEAATPKIEVSKRVTRKTAKAKKK